jgi:hypothetical protein
MGNPKKNKSLKRLKKTARRQYRKAERRAIDNPGRDQRPNIEHEQPPTSLKAKSLPLLSPEEIDESRGQD